MSEQTAQRAEFIIDDLLQAVRHLGQAANHLRSAIGAARADLPQADVNLRGINGTAQLLDWALRQELATWERSVFERRLSAPAAAQ